MSEEGRTVLSFHDSLLKTSDVSLLNGRNWLNDKIIGFYFEYLEYETYQQFSDDVCFITPDVTQFIKLYEGVELTIFLEPLRLKEKKLVLLAVNDNAFTERAGGSHWSLLIFSREENSFFHYDSCRQKNSNPAHLCSKRLTPFLKAPSQPKYHEVENCPQQENSYDCGVYAMCFAEVVCASRLKGREERDMLLTVGPRMASEWRTKTCSLISSLAKR